MKAFNRQLIEARDTASPMLARIKSFTQHEGENASFQRTDGTVVDMKYKESSKTLNISIEDVPELTLDKLFQKVADLGKQMGQEQAQALLDLLDETTKRAGNSFDLKGKQLTKSIFLKMIGRIHISFDRHGKPQMPALWANPKQITNFQQKMEEWSKDPKFTASLNSLMERKRSEFYERANLRTLAD